MKNHKTTAKHIQQELTDQSNCVRIRCFSLFYIIYNVFWTVGWMNKTFKNVTMNLVLHLLDSARPHRK